MNLLTNPLYQAVVHHADEDPPRLIFADWLEEQGQPIWAEVIRTQCRRSQLGQMPWENPREYQSTLQQIEKYGPAWMMGLPRYRGVQSGLSQVLGATFVRGFPEWGQFQSIEALRNAWTRIPNESTMRRFWIGISTRNEDRDNWVRWNADEPTLSAIRELDFSPSGNGFDPIAQNAWAESPHWSGLTGIRSRFSDWDESAWRNWLIAPTKRGIRDLVIHDLDFSNSKLQAMADPEQAGRWRSLNVAYHPDAVSSETLRDLWRSPAVSRLEQWVWSGEQIHEVWFRAMEESSAPLRSVDLPNVRISATHLQRLLQSHHRLQRLRVPLANPNDLSVFQQSNIARLTELEIDLGWQAGPELEILAESPVCQSLEQLTIRVHRCPRSIRERLQQRFGDRLQLVIWER
ncbi:TIGR02996 domain-containing protein [Tuwongella immobilis]|uniref:Repeat-companion domain protein n=1 Tax=Tuwongella immobilis TaxID=692036 RepID=A0A6C2YLP3_9BACT|nr:TIGR02996 domain-containing protein [Tuwongella immobilis]VIP02346.1 unnamed protein product [Tuwongella immobilis]VTS01124.1 unnamed protein product [Tuwongella immobilis]